VPDPRHEAFYVGYLERAPAPLSAWVRPRVGGLLLGAVLLATLLAALQSPFSRAVFEFGTIRSFEGRVELVPYPHLRVERPGGGASRYLLVGSGKRGAVDELGPYEGKRVRLDGTLVYCEDRTLIEIVAGSVAQVGSAADPRRPTPTGEEAWSADLGTHTLRGEIVDSKCFLGVMKPGHLKPHRACATRCISGGIPPVLLVRDARGRASYYLLASEGGEPVGSRVLDLVAEPVEITGRVLRYDDLSVLRADPATYRRVE